MCEREMNREELSAGSERRMQALNVERQKRATRKENERRSTHAHVHKQIRASHSNHHLKSCTYRTTVAIALGRRDGQASLLARAHVQEAVVPPLDDLYEKEVDG